MYIKVGFIFLDFLSKEDVACNGINYAKILGILRINLNFNLLQRHLYFFFKFSTYSAKLNPVYFEVLHSFVRFGSRGGVLPIMVYMGRLRLKGVPFSGFRSMKGWGNLSLGP